MSFPGLISLRAGRPQPRHDAARGAAAAADRALREDPVGALAYGAGSGYAPLREWIAERNGVEPERVFVANGSLEAGMLLFDTARRAAATRSSWRRPSYDRTLLGLQRRGAELTAVPLEDDGIDVGRAGARCSTAACGRS